MSRVAKLGVFLGCFAIGTMFVAASKAHARLQYCKAFIAKYEKVKEAKTAKCAICHPKGEGKTKKDRNDYGVALSKLLATKNQKDAKKIEEALKKAEAEKSAVKGKKFGDLLKEGKLPGSTEKK